MRSSRLGQVGIPSAIVAIIVMMVVPLPTILLDLLIVVSISASLLILLTSMYVQKPLDFSIFPSVLLIATLFRLALNISATRLILLNGYGGKVIHSFGEFVIGGSVVVGLVIFLILIVINFVVITNGSGRVAEVAARFTLDAMPGKQMAIDADLNAGVITEEQAKLRRAEIADEADFYGAMDGASKFVKGDAMAAIIIVAVNLIGGFAIGIGQQGLSFSEAISTYALLSVGEGLVSQIPSLLVSLSAGLIVTRAASQGDLGTDLIYQLGRNKRALQVAGGAILGLALIPSLPKFPFIVVGGGILALSLRVASQEEIEAAEEAEAQASAAAEVAAATPEIHPDSPEALAMEMRVEPLELEIAFDLVDLVDASKGGDLLDRVKALRRKLAMELGIVMPLIRTRDNLDLPPSTYIIRVHGIEMARGEAPAGTVLAIGDQLEGLPGSHTKEPVFGLPAVWVPIEFRHQAELANATIVDRSAVLTTHLAEVARRNAGRLLTRQDVKELLELITNQNPVMGEEITTSGLSLGEIQRVLIALLEEHISVRDMNRVIEMVTERARATKDSEHLVEAVRQGLGPAISAQYIVDGRIPIITFAPVIEQAMLEGLRQGDSGTFIAMDPTIAEQVVINTAHTVEQVEQAGRTPILVCSPQIRAAVRKLVRAGAPNLPVLSYVEIGDHVQLDTVGMVNLGQPATV